MENKFSWTQEYRRSWEETAKENEEIYQTKDKIYNPNKKCIIRHLLVAIDSSSSIEKSDYVPTIRSHVANIIPKFTETFKKSNPLSILSFITCSNVFEKYSKEFNSNNLLSTIGSGDFSLLNCLKTGLEFLKDISYTRELLIITASINTKDAGAYDTIFQDLKKFNIKISIINICSEVMLFKKVCATTNGMFCVPTSSNNFESILMKFTEPLESFEPTISLVKLGFPKLLNTKAICICHLKVCDQVYECPICKTFICSLPMQCPICETQLVTSLNISKSYYYQYPIKPFEPCVDQSCKKCGKPSKSKCQKCKSAYCKECDEFIQNDLNFCIFCSN